MRPATRILLTGLVLWGSALSAQQTVRSNAALIANDHYTRSHDFDLIHQRIVVSHFDWDSTAFEGSVTTRLAARREGLDSVILDEGALLANTAITDAAGRALRASRHGDTLVVFLPRPLAFGDTTSFTITYHGKVASGHGLTFLTNDGREHRPNQIWSQGEDHDNHYWFPTYDFPNDKMTWELSATVPREDLAISNGRLVSNTVAGATRTMTWSQDTPSATYLVSLIVAPLAKIHDSWNGVPVDYYTYHEDSTLAWRLFHVTPDMIGTYSRLTGVPYPWAKYAQTTVADFFGGMENVSATTLVDWLPDARAYLDRPWYQYILIPHELAHQWFGDYVTTGNWANMWLNEGFAEFMPGQYWEAKLGAHAAEDYYADEYRQFMQIEHQRSMPLASLGSNNIYPKGALVLRMLKDYLGPARFWASIHAYLVAHAHDNATSDDLRQAVLAATGENLDWFWDEWVYGAGLPQFAVHATYDTAAARLSLAVEQTQVDTFQVDSTGRKFSVAPVFRMPVAIRVTWQGGDTTAMAQLDARSQTIVIEGVRLPPTMVVFDAGNHILKTLDFEQPIAWLAEELARDPDLWDRAWAINELAQHRGDPAAARVLSTAATTADYFLTRQQAVEALSGFASSPAAPALIAAAHDTSAAVREAAFQALGQVGGADVAALARQAFLHDSSYQVQAAALIAAARSDSSHVRDLAHQALGMSSYQDAIRNAAYQVTVGTNDTTAIPLLAGLIGHEESPAHVLALLGGRGNAHALDLLQGFLNDARLAVRQWALNALRGTLAQAHRDLALARLRAAEPGLRYAETKRAVAAAITALQKQP